MLEILGVLFLCLVNYIFIILIKLWLIDSGFITGFIIQKCNWVLLQKNSMCRLIQEVMFCGSVVAHAMVVLQRVDSKYCLFFSIFILLLWFKSCSIFQTIGAICCYGF
jgi:uncharacterized membrane protein